MALKFQCESCSADVFVQYLRPGEETQCKAYRRRMLVPVAATIVDDVVVPQVPSSPTPAGPDVAGENPERAVPGYLAPRWKRLVGLLIDQFLAAILLVVIFLPASKEMPPTVTTRHQAFEWLSGTPECQLGQDGPARSDDGVARQFVLRPLSRGSESLA